MQATTNTLIPDQANVKHECGEQTNQLAVENEDLGMEEPPLIYLGIEPTFIEKIQKLEKQQALPCLLAGHELSVLTRDSYNDLVTELNEMKSKFAEKQNQFDSINALKNFCEEKETKIVEIGKMYTDYIVANRSNAELKSEIDIKSVQIEESKKEISSLKGTITKNKNKTDEVEEKLRKIFNNIMAYQIGKKSVFK